MFERGASLAWRGAGATNLRSSCASAKLIQKLLQILPLDEDNVIFFQGLLEFGAGDKIIVALPPGRTEVRGIQSYGLQFGIVIAEVNDHFGEAGFQVLHCMDLKIPPFIPSDP